MIISQRYGFVFVHIPKCAGTSVRTQIAACDPDHVAMAELGDHPTLGTIDYGHVQLARLREFFPDEYAALSELPAFAIVRDPLTRFGSSLRQTLWAYEKTPMTLIPQDVLKSRTREILDELQTQIDEPSHRFIFFARQHDFVFDGNRRMVENLVPIQQVGSLISYLSRVTGKAMDPARHSNQNVDLRAKWLGPIAFRANDILRRTLPLGLHGRIKDAAVSLLASKKSAAETSGILDLPEVRDFVAEHYAEDARLYETAMSEAPELMERLETGTISVEKGQSQESGASI